MLLNVHILFHSIIVSVESTYLLLMIFESRHMWSDEVSRGWWWVEMVGAMSPGIICIEWPWSSYGDWVFQSGVQHALQRWPYMGIGFGLQNHLPRPLLCVLAEHPPVTEAKCRYYLRILSSSFNNDFHKIQLSHPTTHEICPFLFRRGSLVRWELWSSAASWHRAQYFRWRNECLFEAYLSKRLL